MRIHFECCFPYFDLLTGLWHKRIWLFIVTVLSSYLPFTSKLYVSHIKKKDYFSKKLDALEKMVLPSSDDWVWRRTWIQMGYITGLKAGQLQHHSEIKGRMRKCISIQRWNAKIVGTWNLPDSRYFFLITSLSYWKKIMKIRELYIHSRSGKALNTAL